MPKLKEEKINKRQDAPRVVLGGERHCNVAESTGRPQPQKLGLIRDMSEAIGCQIVNEIHAPDTKAT
jgi:hypothetical protein